MAEKKQPKRASVRRRTARMVGGPVGLAAQNVKKLAEQLRDQQQTADHLEALQERQNHLNAIALKAESLVEAHRVLKVAGIQLVPHNTIATSRQAVRDLRDRYANDPFTVRQQARTIDAPLASSESAMQQAWAQLAGPSANASALAELLGRFNQFRVAGAAIRKICEQLTIASRTLPRSAKDLTSVRDGQSQLQNLIETLKGEGLDTDVLQFLRDSVNGVPLEELLGKKAVLEFLRTHQLISSLTVTFRSSPQVKK